MTEQTQKLTAVEWLSERLIRMIPTITPMYKYDIKEYVEQAKAMEKEQIINACEHFADYPFNEQDYQQYYNETYNK
jgi:hypothetical protein